MLLSDHVARMGVPASVGSPVVVVIEALFMVSILVNLVPFRAGCYDAVLLLLRSVGGACGPLAHGLPAS